MDTNPARQTVRSRFLTPVCGSQPGDPGCQPAASLIRASAHHGSTGEGLVHAHVHEASRAVVPDQTATAQHGRPSPSPANLLSTTPHFLNRFRPLVRQPTSDHTAGHLQKPYANGGLDPVGPAMVFGAREKL